MQNTQCGRIPANNCNPGGTFHTFYARVTVNDPTDPSVGQLGGGLGSGRWVGGEQELRFNATDNVGINNAAMRIGGKTVGPVSAGCNYALPKPGNDFGGPLPFNTRSVADGVHDLTFLVTDCAGNYGGTGTKVKIDNTPPARVSPSVVGGDGWRGHNSFDVAWEPRPDGFAPVVGVGYKLCSPSGACTSGYEPGQSLQSVSVRGPGEHSLVVSVVDEAGNVSPESDAVKLRLDPDAPTAAFDAPDPGNPLRVSVTARDEASGVAGGQIEIRRRGREAWRPLRTALEGSTTLVARVNDERFGRGRYELRARAVDRAGNERSTNRRADGSPATVALPVRFSTRLRAGIRRVRVKRTRVRRRGRVRVVRKRSVRYIGARRIRARRKIKVRGSLTNPDGQPIPGATINVATRPRYGRRSFRQIARVTTGRRGRFTYIARARFSRLLRFRYPGTGTVRAARATFVMKVPARVKIAVNRRRVTFSGSVRFRGKVLGKIPEGGKVTTLQARVPGGWRTFATPRAGRRGRWSFRYQFAATSGLQRYRFRSCVPRGEGYLYDRGCSRTVTVTVRGP